MFGGFGGGAQRYMAAKEQAGKATRRTVTTEEFVKLGVADGMDESKAQMQAKINRVLGAETLVGGEMLAVKD